MDECLCLSECSAIAVVVVVVERAKREREREKGWNEECVGFALAFACHKITPNDDEYVNAPPQLYTTFPFFLSAAAAAADE